MADIHLSIAGTTYTLACADGEESRLRELGAVVAQQVEAARAIGPGMTETRALLFAALYLADQLESERETARTTLAKDTQLASTLDAAALRIDKMAQKVAAVSARLG